MLAFVWTQAQAAPEATEQEYAHRAAEDVGQGMKEDSEHGARPGI
jgi:hypothetical protein